MKIFLILLFVAAASAIKIQCRFSASYSLVLLNQVYTCDVRSVDYSDNPTTVTDFTGSHLANYSSADVKFITFENSCSSFNLTTVPKGLLTFFPNFVAFRFWGCAIDKLNGDELVGYPSLQWITIYETNLTRIPGNFLKATPNIKFVNFNNNKIQHVGENLFNNLTSLQEIWFDSNICINERAYGPSQIPPFIEKLRQNCPDIATTTLAPSTNCDAYIAKIVELTTKLGDQAAILQQKEIELAQVKQENSILKATC